MGTKHRRITVWNGLDILRVSALGLVENVGLNIPASGWDVGGKHDAQ